MATAKKIVEFILAQPEQKYKFSWVHNGTNIFQNFFYTLDIQVKEFEEDNCVYTISIKDDEIITIETDSLEKDIKYWGLETTRSDSLFVYQPVLENTNPDFFAYVIKKSNKFPMRM